jgi:uncharacterized membrane protein YphA (DoxX/SURF4 family)
MGLLLLRAATGLAAVAFGASTLTSPGVPVLQAWWCGIAEVVCGVGLLAGILTLPVSVIFILARVVEILGSADMQPPNLVTISRHLPFVIVMALVVGITGPGAYSLDCRLFGRREIIIPPHQHACEPKLD